jgi:hypothetical protein
VIKNPPYSAALNRWSASASCFPDFALPCSSCVNDPVPALFVGVQPDASRENLRERRALNICRRSGGENFLADTLRRQGPDRAALGQSEQPIDELIVFAAVTVEGIGVDRDRADARVERAASPGVRSIEDKDGVIAVRSRLP